MKHKKTFRPNEGIEGKLSTYIPEKIAEEEKTATITTV